MTDFDVVVVGGGPGGLSAALALGRARRRVLLVDGGTWRNAAATHVHTFLTRDGTPPDEMRRLGREQLQPYETVELRQDRIVSIHGEADAFVIEGATRATARRVLLAVGMIDEMLPIPGFDALWGTSIVQCPYCHGFEQKDQRFGVMITMPMMAEMALLLRNWTASVTAFVMPGVALEDAMRGRLTRAGVTLEDRPITSLVGEHGKITSVAVEGGEIACDLLFVRPPQRQTDLVASLGLALDEHGYVTVDAWRATSRPGIYAAGDLTTPMQSAINAAAFGAQTAAMLLHELTVSSAL